MKRLATMTAMALVLMAAPAMAVETCEVDGEAGLPTAWGECMTPTLYNELFSYESLSATPSLTSDQSIAAEAGIEAPDVPSERLLGEGMVETPRTFEEIVWWHTAGPR